MQDVKTLVKEIQYSNSTLSSNNSNSTVEPSNVLLKIPDVIHEGYEPFYIRKLNELGYTRFMELVNKARAGSDTPERLFSWMLKNNKIVN